MWYMHDSAPAHSSRVLWDVLSNTYLDRRIGTGGPIAWPPRSPYLNPLDFCLWGHLKILVYAAPVDNEEALHNRILDACQTVHNYPGIFEGMRRSMMRRIEAFIKSHGGRFSTFYKCTLSAVTHKLNVSGYMSIWTFFLIEGLTERCEQTLGTSFTDTHTCKKVNFLCLINYVLCHEDILGADVLYIAP
jgi:hypothetical protein